MGSFALGSSLCVISVRLHSSSFTLSICNGLSSAVFWSDLKEAMVSFSRLMKCVTISFRSFCFVLFTYQVRLYLAHIVSFCCPFFINEHNLSWFVEVKNGVWTQESSNTVIDSFLFPHEHLINRTIHLFQCRGSTRFKWTLDFSLSKVLCHELTCIRSGHGFLLHRKSR